MPSTRPYTKRATARAMIEVMEALGYARFRLAGTTAAAASPIGWRSIIQGGSRNRGARHRADLGNVAPHGRAARQPRPGTDASRRRGAASETLIGKAALFDDERAAAGTKSKSLAAFDLARAAHYHAFFDDPVRIHATCETIAPAAPPTSPTTRSRAAGEKIACPLLAISLPAASRPRPRACSRLLARMGDVRGLSARLRALSRRGVRRKRRRAR